MNALDVAKALFALSEKDQKTIVELWQSLRQQEPKPMRVVKQKKKTSPQYTQDQYELMQSEFQYSIDKKGIVDEKTCLRLAKMLGRTLSAIKRAAWTYANDKQTWDKRLAKLCDSQVNDKEQKVGKKSGPIIYSAASIKND